MIEVVAVRTWWLLHFEKTCFLSYHFKTCKQMWHFVKQLWNQATQISVTISSGHARDFPSSGFAASSWDLETDIGLANVRF